MSGDQPIDLPKVGDKYVCGAYRIVNAHSGRALSLSPGEGDSGAQVKQFTVDASIDQIWVLEDVLPSECDRTPLHPNLFRIRHARTGLYLDADGNRRGLNGYPVLVWDREAQPKNFITPFPNAQQLWGINRVAELKYQIINPIDLVVAIECRSLDAPTETSDQNGVAVQLWTPHHGENQKWQFIPATAPERPKTVGDAGTIAAVYGSARGHAEGLHVGVNGRLRYAYVHAGAWRSDTTHLGDGAPFTGPVSAVYEPNRGHTAAIARGSDGRLRYFYVHGGAWMVDADTLGQATGAVSAVFSSARNHTEVFFAGADGHLNYSYVDGGAWHHHREGFGVVGGAVSAVFSPARNHSEVFWVRADGRLIYSYVADGAWHHDANALAAAGQVGAVSAVYSTARNHSEVFAAGADGKVHYFHVAGGAWHHDSSSFGNTRGQLAATYSPARGHSELVFVRDDGRPVYAYVEGGAWKRDDLTFAVAGPVKDVAMVFSPSRNHSEVFFTGTDGFLHYFYVLDRGNRGYPAWHRSSL